MQVTVKDESSSAVDIQGEIGKMYEETAKVKNMEFAVDKGHTTGISTAVVKDNEQKVEPTSRKERRATARAREQRVNKFEKDVQQRFRELQAKINNMDAYFLELAAIIGIDLAVIVGTGGDPVEVMRERIQSLAEFERMHTAVSEEERAG